jgi:hypothetical protein
MGRYSDKVMSKMPTDMKSARFKLELNRVFREQTIKEKYKMGYRSTVAYTIRFTPVPDNNVDSPTAEAVKECNASFYCFLAEAKVKCSGAFAEEFGVKVDERNMAINFLAEHVKWYEDYEDVQVHESLMSLSKAWEEMENKYIGGIFIRIGEEMDDIVQEEWGEVDWEWLAIHRQIVADWE